MLLAKGAWVVVADGEKALVLQNTGTPKKPELGLIDRAEADLQIPGAATEAPGRVYESAGGTRVSALEQPDYARMAADRFAADLAATLAAAARKGRFGQLVLAAPPQVLGALREAMSAELRALVVLELPKTLTNHALPKIAGLVVDALAAL